MFKRESAQDRIFNVIVVCIAVFVLIITFYPLYFVIIASISQPEDIVLGKVIFAPSGFNVAGYKHILRENSIWLGYRNTIVYTTFGTILALFMTLLAGYALSRKDLVGRGAIMKLYAFTMFFHGGLIPSYIIVKNLGLVNTPYVLIILGSMSVYNVIITRTFFQNTIPDELLEASFLDGCGNINFFIKVVLPLSKAIIGVIALYYAVGYWNSFFNALIYTTRRDLYPLQLVLRDLLVRGVELSQYIDQLNPEELAERRRIAEIIKYCIIIVSTLPVISVYPFIQKYFVQGVMIGSLKG